MSKDTDFETGGDMNKSMASTAPFHGFTTILLVLKDGTLGKIRHRQTSSNSFLWHQRPQRQQDPLRAELYSEPTHFYKPTELMGVPWVAHHSRDWVMGSLGHGKRMAEAR